MAVTYTRVWLQFDPPCSSDIDVIEQGLAKDKSRKDGLLTYGEFLTYIDTIIES